jgi:ligand-binding SRPBCC domain-containing protein
MQLGDTVTWEAVHFFVRQHLTSKIVAYERPCMFVDEMQRGAFKRWRHTHRFGPRPDGTLMLDDVDFAAPFGPLGRLAETLLLKRYMTGFLVKHNLFFKRMAEATAGHTPPPQSSLSTSSTAARAREA